MVIVKRDVELLPAVGEDAADFAVVGVGGQLLPLGVGGINPRHQVVVLPVVVRSGLDAPLLPGVVQAGKLLLKLRQVVLGDALRGVLKAQEVHLLAAHDGFHLAEHDGFQPMLERHRPKIALLFEVAR